MFSLGQLVSTPGALEALAANEQSPAEFITRHLKGDWGTLNQEDKNENDRSVRDGDRLLSAYVLKDGTKIWIITEADRSSTCVLLPEEY
jgi:hypothetical protein